MADRPGQLVDGIAGALAALLEVPARLASLEAEVRSLREEVAALRRSSPPTAVTLPEAAQRLGVSVSTLRRRIRAGDLPVVRVGRAVRIDVAVLRHGDDAEVVRLAEAARRPR